MLSHQRCEYKTYSWQLQASLAPAEIPLHTVFGNNRNTYCTVGTSPHGGQFQRIDLMSKPLRTKGPESGSNETCLVRKRLGGKVLQQRC